MPVSYTHLRAEVIGARTVRVLNVERKEAREQPPLLYDLTTLQLSLIHIFLILIMFGG